MFTFRNVLIIIEKKAKQRIVHSVNTFNLEPIYGGEDINKQTVFTFSLC